MLELSEIMDSNKDYQARFAFDNLAMPPSRKLAVVACMDARLNVPEALGLSTGEAHIIRNAGGLVTDDVIRSLVISYKLLGTREFLVIEHTDCGMLTFTNDDIRAKLKAEEGADASNIDFLPFPDLESNLREQVDKIRRSPLIPEFIPVHGLIYDVSTGGLRHVLSA